MFDDISYDKGASVLRMLRAFLTRDITPQPALRRSLQQVCSVMSPCIHTVITHCQVFGQVFKSNNGCRCLYVNLMRKESLPLLISQ